MRWAGMVVSSITSEVVSVTPSAVISFTGTEGILSPGRIVKTQSPAQINSNAAYRGRRTLDQDASCVDSADIISRWTTNGPSGVM